MPAPMTVPGHALSAGGPWRDFRRLALFMAKRILALLLTVLVGVYLTILIANMGGGIL